jgi:hypothetical protein
MDKTTITAHDKKAIPPKDTLKIPNTQKRKQYEDHVHDLNRKIIIRIKH